MISINNLALNGVLTMDIAKKVMMNEGVKKKQQGIVNESQTLVMEKKDKRERNKIRGSNNRNDKSKCRSESQNNNAYFYCKKNGHYMKVCKILKWKQVENRAKASRTKNIVKRLQ